MITTVIKRDGRKRPFNLGKIFTAINAAASSSLSPERVEELTQAVKAKLYKDHLSVETIQDIVEQTLVENQEYELAKSYILYRNNRTKARDINSTLNRTIFDLVSLEAKDSDTKRENANIDGNAPMGIMLQFGSEISKKFSLDNLIKPEQAEAHKKGWMHIHDLNFYPITFNCCQIPAGKLLRSGFSTGHGYIRKPNGIQSAAALMCIILQANQNEMFGGQAIPTFEYDLAPFVVDTFTKHYLELLTYHGYEVYKDKVKEIIKSKYTKNNTLNGEIILFNDENDPPHLDDLGKDISKESWRRTKIDTYQAMEALIHNLNTMQSRAGAQVPFSSINYGTGTTCEQRLVIEAVLKATEKGLGNGETPIFPVQVFKLKDGVNTKEGDPNYDLFQLACKVSALRLFPNFSFIDAPYNLQYYREGYPETELAVMGCRTRVMGNLHGEEIPVGRGNIAFTTINLPRLGLLAKGSISVFYKELHKMLDLAYQNLIDRFNLIKNKHAYNFPFLFGEDIWMDSDKLTDEDTIEKALKHGSLSIGFIGLAECLVALMGKHHGECAEAQEIGLDIIEYMRDYCDKRAKETNLNISLFATPAEGLSGRFVKYDRKEFGIVKGVTDKDYYTNSSHVPVYYEITAAKKISIEAPYHALCNAGHICYVEVDGDIGKNIKAFENIILYMKKCHCTYGSINHPVDFCPVCGYVGIIHDTCPKCGRKDGEGVSIEHLHSIGCKCN